MIVTRQRRKPFNFGRLILPLVAIALIVFAFAWPPSRNVITSGPMSPVWRIAGNFWDGIAAPFHFAAQNQVITDRNRQIAMLQNQLTTAQNDAQSKTKQIAALQSQMDQMQAQAASTRAAPSANSARVAPRPAASAGAFGAASMSGDLSSGASADMRRTAQYWTAMDPENAAKLAQKLPPSYDARVFALMPPEAVGAILDALPPSFAAKLTQEHPDLQR